MPLPHLPPPDEDDIYLTSAELEQLLATTKEVEQLQEGNPTVTQALAADRQRRKLLRRLLHGVARQWRHTLSSTEPGKD